MIRLVNGGDRHQHADIVDQMYRIRAAVFNERLGWDVEVKDGREIDQFDDEAPLYLISINEKTAQVQGALRLLRTTGPNMLRDVFPVLLKPGEVVESPLIWESSRFSINPDLSQRTASGEVNHVLSIVTMELLCGIVEVCQLASIDSVVSVFDARMLRIFRAADCPTNVIGTPTKIGRVMTYAGMFEISDDMRTRLARAGGINGSVLEQSAANRKDHAA